MECLMFALRIKTGIQFHLMLTPHRHRPSSRRAYPQPFPSFILPLSPLPTHSPILPLPPTPSNGMRIGGPAEAGTRWDELCLALTSNLFSHCSAGTGLVSLMSLLSRHRLRVSYLTAQQAQASCPLSFSKAATGLVSLISLLSRHWPRVSYLSDQQALASYLLSLRSAGTGLISLISQLS